MELFDRLDGARERWNVLRHPFYLRWERGELTRDELAFYAGEYRHVVVALARTAAVGGSTNLLATSAERWGSDGRRRSKRPRSCTPSSPGSPRSRERSSRVSSSTTTSNPTRPPPGTSRSTRRATTRTQLNRARSSNAKQPVQTPTGSLPRRRPRSRGTGACSTASKRLGRDVGRGQPAGDAAPTTLGVVRG